MGSALNGIFGLLKVLENNSGTNGLDVEHIYRQALRWKGAGLSLTTAADAYEITKAGGTGPVGDKGATGDTGVAGAVGVVGAIGLHDTTYSPVLLCQFQGARTDTSGNSLTPTVDAGTELYSTMVPSLQGIKLDGTLRLKVATNALLALHNDMTVEMLLLLSGDTAINSQIISYTFGVDDTSSTFNYLYQINFTDATRRPSWFQEFGTGSDSSVSVADQALPKRQLFHLAATRISNVIQFYLNGRAFGAPGSVTQTTDGTASSLYIGGEGGPTPHFSSPMLMASLKIIPSGLAPAQIRGEYNLTAGQFYGQI